MRTARCTVGRGPGTPTSQLLFPAQLHLLLIHGDVDGPEVGHDGHKVLEVDLVGQATGPLAQVPVGARRGCRKCIQNRSSSCGCPQPQRNWPFQALALPTMAVPALGSATQCPAHGGAPGGPWGVSPAPVLHSPHPETTIWGSGGDTGSCVCGAGAAGHAWCTELGGNSPGTSRDPFL